MASFILQPCRLRADRLVPTKDEVVTFEWEDLVERLAPSKSLQAKMTLRKLQKGAFIGTTRQAESQSPTNFLLVMPDRSGRIGGLIKQDPSFPERLLEVFQVQSVDWDDSLDEIRTHVKEDRN